MLELGSQLLNVQVRINYSLLLPGRTLALVLAIVVALVTIAG